MGKGYVYSAALRYKFFFVRIERMERLMNNKYSLVAFLLESDNDLEINFPLALMCSDNFHVDDERQTNNNGNKLTSQTQKKHAGKLTHASIFSLLRLPLLHFIKSFFRKCRKGEMLKKIQ
jgi:hypothetical protein